MNKRLIIAAYRLPYGISKKNNKVVLKQNSGGLVSAILSLTQKSDPTKNNADEKIVWFGAVESELRSLEKEPYETESFILKPVYVDKRLNKNFYLGFCNATIWPLFHYYPFITKYEESYFEAYREANELFYKEMKKTIREDDVIWIHDYHLFLLPALIRKDFPKIQIGFFLHIPFPSFEIFRLLPKHWSQEILKGILGADLIGFHTNDYTQHFITSVRRIMGYESDMRNIYTEDRVVHTDAFPISIDYEKFHEACNDVKVVAVRKRILKHMKGQKIIFSVDRLDYSKGLMHRLAGFEYFLSENPSWHGKVQYIMVTVPSRDTIPSYAEIKREMEETIGRINGKYSSINWTPINYQYRSLSFEELIALYSASDVALVTPIRDGMNLVAKEYVAARNDEKGVLILSEMTGSAAELGEAILINPTDKTEIAASLQTALDMDPHEQEVRIKSMQKRIRNYDVFLWSKDFMSQLEKTKELQTAMNVKLITEGIKNNLFKKYQQAQHSILFLDYDGTLVPFSKDPLLAVPDKDLLTLLNKLSEKTEIVIVSGRDKNILDNWLGHLNISIIAEHGAFIKKLNGEWESNVNHSSLEWKGTVKEIFQRYVKRCTASFIEEKEAAIAWHYRSSEPDFAFVRSRELLDELANLNTILGNVNVIDGNKVIEVKNNDFNKGTALRSFLEQKKYDFVLCAGDDKTDEDMFAVMSPEYFSIKIGREPSRAVYSVKNYKEFLRLLQQLSLLPTLVTT